MSSRREQILTAIKTLLDNTAGVTGKVYRDRVENIRREGLPAVFIEPIAEVANYQNVAFMTWVLQVRVRVITRGDIPDQLADPILNSAYALLMADRTLGLGFVLDVVPASNTFVFEDMDMPAGVVDAVFNITYRTSPSNLEA